MEPVMVCRFWLKNILELLWWKIRRECEKKERESSSGMTKWTEGWKWHELASSCLRSLVRKEVNTNLS